MLKLKRAVGTPLEQDYDTETFIYDTENRLTAYTRTGGSPVEVAYDYDVLGRRAAKTIDPNGATPTVTHYLYDGDQVIGEYDGTGTLLRRYAYASGGGIDEPLVFIDETGATPAFYYYHADARGSIIAMSDASGIAVETYSYSPYGIASITTPTTGQPYRYTGRRFDAETGMYYYRARYYHPTMGRFLQTDPIGYEDNMNLYAYVGNDPMNMVDPSGLAGSCAEFSSLPVRGACWEADISASLDFLEGQGSGIDLSGFINGGGSNSSLTGSSFGSTPDGTPVDETSGTDPLAPYEVKMIENSAAKRVGVDAVRITSRQFQSIQSKHGPATNRIGPNSVFDSQLIANYGTFVNLVLTPLLSSQTPNVRRERWGELRWVALLPYPAGTGLVGQPTSAVELVLRYNWGLSVGGNVWNITGAYPI